MNEINVLQRPNCLICNIEGEPLYTNLQDQLFGAPDEWSLYSCKTCGLIWLNPYPTQDDLWKLYRTYYTHSTGRKHVLSNILLLLDKLALYRLGYRTHRLLFFGQIVVPTIINYIQLGYMSVKKSWGNKLLDVGSGNGEFLAKMKNLGWEVEGQEPDPKAAKFAASTFGVKVHAGDLASCKLPAEYFDVITLNHVIEHAINPKLLLEECLRLLKSGGRLVILTPNSQGLGHNKFKQSWRGLEIPRHVVIFSISNLKILAKSLGYQIETTYSTARIARYLYSTSVHIKEGRMNIGAGGNRGYWLAFLSYGFQLWEELRLLFNSNHGEEIFLVAKKK